MQLSASNAVKKQAFLTKAFAPTRNKGSEIVELDGVSGIHGGTHRLMNKFNNHCLYCKCEVHCKTCYPKKNSDFVATRDHYYPKSRGGSDAQWNIVLACAKCNNKKGDLVLDPTFDHSPHIDTMTPRARRRYLARLEKFRNNEREYNE